MKEIIEEILRFQAVFLMIAIPFGSIFAFVYHSEKQDSEMFEYYMNIGKEESKELNSKTTEGLLRYKCANCGNTCLVNPAPDNSVCGGCDKPDWKLMNVQQPYKETKG